MKWAEISIVTNDEYTHMLSNIFMESGIGDVLEEKKQQDDLKSTTLTAYACDDDMLESKINNLRDHIAVLDILGIELPNTDITVRKIEEEDWANSWKEFFKPFNIGKFVIKPTWEEYTPKSGEIILELDPGMAFGTGQHPTTHLCLQAMGDYTKTGDVVIDAGTGSGILCIAAEKMGMSKAYAFDYDPIATDAASANFKRLGISDKIQVFCDDNPSQITESADIILANIIATVILEMAASLSERVKNGGYLVASGIIDYRCEEVLEKLESCGLKLIEKRMQKEWVCLVMQKPIQ